MIAAVDKAVESGRWIVLVFHGVGGEHVVNVEVEEFAALVAYLDARRMSVWTDTFANVAADIVESRKHDIVQPEVAAGSAKL